MREIIPIILRDLEGFISDAVVEVLRGKEQVRNSRQRDFPRDREIINGRKALKWAERKTAEMGRVKKKDEGIMVGKSVAFSDMIEDRK